MSEIQSLQCNIFLTANPPNVNIGGNVTLTASVAPVPTGSNFVIFNDGTTTLTVLPLPLNGIVSFNWNTQNQLPGIHTITANEITNGVTQCTSGPVDVTVTLPPCTAQLTTDNTIISIGTPVRLNVSITPARSYTVEIRDGNNIIQVINTNSNGTATFSMSTSGLSPGIHNISLNVINPGICTSNIVSITLSPVCQSISLVANPTVIAQNGIVNLTATASPLGKYLVNFKDGDNLLSSIISDENGVTSFDWNTSNIHIGRHDITASVGGIPAQCNSQIIPVDIITIFCNIILTCEKSSVSPGTHIIFTANVIPQGIYDVIFTDNATFLNSIRSDNTGLAIFDWNTTSTTLGVHDVIAVVNTPVQCISSPLQITISRQELLATNILLLIGVLGLGLFLLRK